MSEPIPDRKRVVVQQHSDTEPFEVYHLSHDLRGPLNSILGFTELLLEEIEGPLTDVQKEDISAINQSAQNLLRLINTTVDLSKFDADRLEFNFGEVSLEQVVKNIVVSDTWTNKSGQVEVVVNLPKTLPLLWGDSNRMEQMFEELFRQAFKLKGTQEITIAANGNEKEVTVQIHLAGGMISAADLEEIFRLMIKVDAAGRSHLGPGGLELPLTQRIAEKHEGRIWAESDETGTMFYVSLPTAQAKSQA
jgi:signal transduction histidine kinase